MSETDNGDLAWQIVKEREPLPVKSVEVLVGDDSPR